MNLQKMKLMLQKKHHQILWAGVAIAILILIVILIVSLFLDLEDKKSTQASEFTVNSISPNFGPTGGGTNVIISGTEFVNNPSVLRVDIGENECTNLQFVSSTQLTCITPLGTVGAKDVVVTNGDGQVRTLVGGFTYYAILPLQSSNITLMYCDTPKKVDQTTDCTLFVDTDFIYYTGSLEVRVADEQITTCNLPVSGNFVVCSGVTLPNQVGSYQSKFRVSGETDWQNGNKVNVIIDIYTQGLTLYYDAGHPGSYSGTGQNVLDLSSERKDGFLGQNFFVQDNDPVWVNDQYKSFSFDGVNDLIDTTLNSNFSNDITIEVWFRRANNNSSDNKQTLVNVYHLDQTANCGYGELSNGYWSFGGNACRNRLSLEVRQQTIQATVNNSNTINSTFIPNNLWQMATITHSSNTNETSLFVNGVLHQTTNQELVVGSDGVIKIGTYLDGIGGFEGNIAVVRIYNRVLSQSEIKHNFDQEKTRFGFTNSTVLVSGVPEATNFGVLTVSDQEQTLSATLEGLNFFDRRQLFVPWTATIRITDLTSGDNVITADKISINPQFSQQTVITGSGLYNVLPEAGYFEGANIPRLLLQNLDLNGGGEFVISPEISVDVQPFTRSGVYTGVVTVDIV